TETTGEVLALTCPQRGLLASYTHAEICWSNGVVESMKSQTPSTKLQTNIKFQYQITKTGLEFWSLLFVCYLRFVIWNFYSYNTSVLQNSSQFSLG
ncbi:MAG: hypothetical protein WBH05_06205, partial [Syntrophobacteria bacterium]